MNAKQPAFPVPGVFGSEEVFFPLMHGSGLTKREYIACSLLAAQVQAHRPMTIDDIVTVVLLALRTTDAFLGALTAQPEEEEIIDLEATPEPEVKRHGSL